SGLPRDRLSKLSVVVDPRATQFINSGIAAQSAHDRLGHILDGYRLKPGVARTEEREYRQALEQRQHRVEKDIVPPEHHGWPDNCGVGECGFNRKLPFSAAADVRRT